MKTWTIVLTATMVVAALPLVTAEAACSRAGVTEAIDHPLKEDTYLFLDPTSDKFGEWKEKNRADGLQTMPCFYASGALKYGRDLHVPLLG